LLWNGGSISITAAAMETYDGRKEWLKPYGAVTAPESISDASY
jgi:hypothetical protein